MAAQIRIVKEHDTDIPLFFYVAFQVNHTPLEVPDSYIAKSLLRRTYTNPSVYPCFYAAIDGSLPLFLCRN